jgi:hypothetical protein
MRIFHKRWQHGKYSATYLYDGIGTFYLKIGILQFCDNEYDHPGFLLSLSF